MSHKHNKIKKSNEGRMSEEYVVHRSRLSDIIAIFVCIALALVVWTVVMNTEDTDQIFVKVVDPAVGYTYELSLEHVEVQGTVAALRTAKFVGVRLPQGVQPGEYEIDENDLVLPRGVRLVAPVTLILTVRAK